MKRALILAAHGSQLDPQSSAPAWKLGAQLRSLGRFDVVRPAFWKEEPSFARALDGLDERAVTVVPLFMAPGYFTTVVLPRELAASIAARQPAAPPVSVTAPLGCQPAMAGVVADRAARAGAGRTTTVIVLGHGTERHGGAAANLRIVAQAVAAMSQFAGTVPAFIDQGPSIIDTLPNHRETHVVVVPYFLADGWHVGTTIPAELAAAGFNPAVTAAVGSHSAVAEIVAGLVR